jgi:hypothetical protein
MFWLKPFMGGQNLWAMTQFLALDALDALTPCPPLPVVGAGELRMMAVPFQDTVGELPGRPARRAAKAAGC